MRFSCVITLLCILVTACSDPNLEKVSTKHDNGQVQEQYTRNKKDFAKEGLYKRFYPNGTIQEEATFVRNQYHGERKLFYANGTCEIQEVYRNGVLDGLFKKFYPTGTIHQELYYTNGTLTGIGRTWHPNGVLKEEVNFKDNEENGTFTEYHENGNLKAKGQYLDGPNEHDSLYIYDQNGQLERVMFCENGVCRTAYGKKTE